MRLWDLRQKHASHCINLPKLKHATLVKEEEQNDVKDEITSVLFHPCPRTALLQDCINHNCRIYVSTLSKKVYHYDVRKTSSSSCHNQLNDNNVTATEKFTPPKCRDYTSQFGTIMDDINQISLQPLLQPFESNNGAGLLLLSTADDDGDIRIIETLNDYNYADNRNHQQRAVASTGGKSLSKKNVKGKGGSNKKTRKKGQQQEQQRRAYDGCRVLRHAGASTLSSKEKKEQVALVTSAVFRPPPPSQTKGGHNRYYEIASGGTDCVVHLWDATRPNNYIT